MTISEEAVKAMPERIYAAKKTEGSNCVVSFDTPSLDYNVEYVRADLALPHLPQGEPSAARELALEEAARVAGNFLMLKTGLPVDKIVELEAALRALSSQPVADHADDLAVDSFAIAMKQKLAKKREEGRGGWENKDECSAEYLSYLLIQHIWKGDPLDIANLAMMLQQRGERIVIDSETSSIIPGHADAGKVEGCGSRWRVFEAAVGGYWGIELEQARNDDDPILYPIKVHRDTLARIVDAHNADLPSAPSEGAE